MKKSDFWALPSSLKDTFKQLQFLMNKSSFGLVSATEVKFPAHIF